MKARSDVEATTLRVDLGAQSYDVVIGSDLFDAELPLARADRHTALIVTNETIAPLWASRAQRLISGSFQDVSTLILPDGEAYKTLATLNLVFDTLLRERHDRQTLLVALGGGVIGDITGFAAACFMRGVDYIQIPTTLLAQVDSSVGGKTAVNHPSGKNMIGAFYQPRLVLADVGALATLPQRELVAGLAEVIKYGAACDATFFDWIDENIQRLLARETTRLAYAVKRSCSLKASIVGRDERETGLRAILNFGHTFGHAIEAGLGFGTWLHGEAVGCGMVLAVELSCRLGMIDAKSAARVAALVARAGLPVRLPPLPAPRLAALMLHDKKAEGGAPRFVLLDGLGRARVAAVEERLVLDVLRDHGATA